MRKYTLNEHVLDIIDTEQKAYFLGFFYADGYNYETQNAIRIVLAEQDKQILDDLKTVLETNRPLLTYQSKVKNSQLSLILTIKNKHLSNILKLYGAPQNKSFKIRFPEFIHSSLLQHFIRGYFDADGSISLSYGKHSCYARFSITSNCEFINKLYVYLKSINIDTHIIKDSRCDNISYLVIGDINSAKKFGNYIYHNCHIKLNRKYEKFLEFCNKNCPVIHHLVDHPLREMWIRCRSYAKYYNLEFDSDWCTFLKFYQWALDNNWEHGQYLIRKNINIGYTKSNCCFGSKTQSLNRSNGNRYLTLFGETKSLKEWSRDIRCEIKYTTLFMRLKRNNFNSSDNILKKKYEF